MTRSHNRLASWGAVVVVVGLSFAVNLLATHAEPPKGEQERLHNIEYLLEFYRGQQAWPKEKAASQLVRHGVEAVPVAAKLIADPQEDDDVHHGLLMLQHLYRDPDPTVRGAAKQALQALKKVEADNTSRRADAILALEPVKDANLWYPRGLPAGLGQPRIQFTAKYFGYEPQDGTFYEATVSTDNGVVKIQFGTQGPGFGDGRTSIDIESKLTGNQKTYVEVTADISSGNGAQEPVKSERISAKAKSLQELSEQHPDVMAAYNRVMEDLKRGYKATIFSKKEEDWVKGLRNPNLDK